MADHVTKSSVSKIRTLVQWLVTLTMTNTSWCKPIEFSPFCVSISHPAFTIEAPPLQIYLQCVKFSTFLIELLHSVSKIRTLVQWLVTLTMTNTSWCKPIEFSPFCKHLRYNYENIEHLTNNASESYNSYLNNIFPNKPIFYKLIYILKEEENLSYNDYQRRTKGNWKKKQKIFSATDEIKILIENYKSKEINLFYNGCNRNELIKLWKECLIDLNDININLK
ncbi:hypothetical protein H8356DRAFT_1324629 [Neocallimastix lanati (nom. inval.)]|nr:hypothetical protein H8356DRAFT_1324629 [Neocallimastix sp. JGI-2020a]